MTVIPQPKPRRGPTPGALALIILVASATLVGFGFQQGGFQKTVTDRDTCYQKWGQDMVDTIGTRTDATGRLDKARARRDVAVDNIILAIIVARTERPPISDREADRRWGAVLSGFATAKARLDRVQANTSVTRNQNPYPVLDCTDGTEDGNDDDQEE